VRIAQTGTGTVTWTATPTHPWITVSPASGSGAATLTIGVSFFGGLPVAGVSTGAVNVAFTGAATANARVDVTLTTVAGGASAAPFGTMDTPVDGATGVNGSIAVTGWALDDLEVTAVKVLRDPVAGEGGGLVFIGNAVFVDGARPDVASLNPTRPFNTRAGWGYLMLTNFLPNQGNGTFRIHAYAEDADGHSVLLGTRTITCSNATAIAPFGAIDTPGQGEVVSGLVNNFGWVLAPGGARADVPGGGTVNVVIDGVVVGTPVGWTSRSDLTLLFPSRYSDLNSALAVHTFDSRTLADGVHTIAWGVTATNGESAGIGSRFFTVANGSAAVVAGLQEPGGQRGTGALVIEQPGVDPNPVVASDVNAVPLSPGALRVRTGWRDDGRTHSSAPDADGRIVIDGEELGLFEVTLAGVSERGNTYAGYLRAGRDLLPLPIGSCLDEVTGVFTWQPGVAFVGAYDLAFVRSRGGVPEARHEVRIILHPKGSTRIGPQVVIDLPAPTDFPVASGFSRKDLARPFLVAGWAIDRDDPVGTGVEAIHVWAYPVHGGERGEPVFLGAASYGGIRPDVAAIHGDRFRESGYGLVVESLLPGTYDLAVFAWSTARQGFLLAEVVRMTIR
jgi:hypothetical protein